MKRWREDRKRRKATSVDLKQVKMVDNSSQSEESSDYFEGEEFKEALNKRLAANRHHIVNRRLWKPTQIQKQARQK